MEHADRFLRRFYIEKGMFGSLSLTFFFYRPPLFQLPIKPRIGLVGVGESVWTVDDSRFMILHFRGPYSVSSFEV